MGPVPEVVRSAAGIGQGPLPDEYAHALLWVEPTVGALHRSDQSSGSEALAGLGFVFDAGFEGVPVGRHRG